MEVTKKTKIVKTIKIDVDKCNGCRACEVICSACLTEPGGGTDLGNMQTTAKRVAGGWRLTGTKVFISHAAHAGVFLVGASVDRAQKHKGVTAFVVDPHATDGITIGEFPMRTLKRDNLAEVSFQDAFVPDAALLGEPGKGEKRLDRRTRFEHISYRPVTQSAGIKVRVIGVV